MYKYTNYNYIFRVKVPLIVIAAAVESLVKKAVDSNQSSSSVTLVNANVASRGVSYP